MFQYRVSSLFVALLTIAFTAGAEADALTSFDEHTVYALSTEAGGTGVRLDVATDRKTVHLDRSAKVTGQAWHLRKSDRGTWVLGTEFTGACKRLAVASAGAGDTVRMAKKQDDSKPQNWVVRLTSDHQFIRLTSEQQGTQVALSAVDTPPGGVRLVPIAKDPHQHWIVTPTGNTTDTGECSSR